MGCFTFIGDILGLNIVFRGLRSRPVLTVLLLSLFWGWALLTGAMIVRYAHLGEHPYVFEILPVASCISPVTAVMGVLFFTVGDAFTNLFSGALTNTFGIRPPVDLYQVFGRPSPLLTWGAYVRLNLVGLMAYAILPGFLGRTAFRLVQVPLRLLRAKVIADGPVRDAAFGSGAASAVEMMVGYVAAVAGAVAGTAVGGGLYYADMYAEYFPIRQLTHPSGQPDPSCFKMDADYAVQNVVAGGTTTPAGGAAVVVSGGGAEGSGGGGTGSGEGKPGTGKPPPGAGGGGGDGKNLEYGDKIISMLSELRDLAGGPDADGVRPDADGVRPDADGVRPDADGARPDADGARPDADGAGSDLEVGMIDIANMLYDWQNLMQKDGMNWFEAGVTSISSNLAANYATANMGTIDFVAGIFFPQSMQGYVPSNVVKDSVKAGVNAVKALGSALGGDEQALDKFGESAHKGDQGKVAEGYANIAEVLGSLSGDPKGTLEDFADGCKEIWEAGPLELAEDAINQFADDCLNGKEGPMAQAIAELAGGAGTFAEDPVGTTKQFGEDVKVIVENGEVGEIFFGEEGSENAVKILGPIGEGYKEIANIAGEAYEDPGKFATDVKNTAVYVAQETGTAIANGAKAVAKGITTGFGLWG